MDLITFAATAAAVSAVVAAVSQVVEARRAKQRLKETRKRLSETKAASVLQDPTLSRLGRYVFEDVGSVTVRDYVTDDRLHRELPGALDSIRRYLELPSEDQKGPEHTQAWDRTRGGLQGHDVPDFVLTRIEEGDYWTALAWLRTQIERSLRELAHAHSLQVREQVRARSLLSLLRREQLISDDVVEALDYAIRVANRGVHGLDVSLGETEEAILVAWQVWEDLGRRS